jgi:hypothetical protein
LISTVITSWTLPEQPGSKLVQLLVTVVGGVTVVVAGGVTVTVVGGVTVVEVGGATVVEVGALIVSPKLVVACRLPGSVAVKVKVL